MNNSYQKMVEIIDTLKTEGKAPKVIVLASQVNRNRKSLM